MPAISPEPESPERATTGADDFTPASPKSLTLRTSRACAAITAAFTNDNKMIRENRHA